jgi:hypothetical protein
MQRFSAKHGFSAASMMTRLALLCSEMHGEHGIPTDLLKGWTKDISKKINRLLR